MKIKLGRSKLLSSWDRGLAWYDSGFGYLRSSVQIRPIPFFLGFHARFCATLDYDVGVIDLLEIKKKEGMA